MSLPQKYLILRRDGSIPRWPAFVLGAADPAAPAALRAYADECERMGMLSHYVRYVRALAEEFQAFPGESDPDEPDRRATCEFVQRLLGTEKDTAVVQLADEPVPL